jgi:quercetin dioxygenase-like cupin family protein
MTKGFPMSIILLVLAAVSVSSQQGGVARQPAQSHIVPLKEFAAGQTFETVSGDPTKEGEIFVIRIHREAGYIIMPHTHPMDEHTVVVKGTWAFGMGDRYDPQGLVPMEVGTYALAPKNMAHFGLSKTETVTQVHGIGPFKTHRLVPIYELNVKGIFYDPSATQPGKLTSTSPPDCFLLKLGTRVRGSYGEGVVVAAQCTPGQLTQYRIEKPDGENFWAQRDDLNTP